MDVIAQNARSTQPKKKWRVIRCSTSTRGGPGPALKGDVVELASAIYKRDLRSIDYPPGSTTDAILQDPVWRKRLLASLDQARRGQMRPIEEYWAESDAEDG
jgi:hypothetical protein